MADLQENAVAKPICADLSYEDRNHHIHELEMVDISSHLLGLFHSGDEAEAAYDNGDLVEMLAHTLEEDRPIVDDYGHQRPWLAHSFDLAQSLEEALSEISSDTTLAELWDRWASAMQGTSLVQERANAQIQIGLERFQALLSTNPSISHGEGLSRMLRQIFTLPGAINAMITALSDNDKSDPVLTLRAVSALQSREA